MGRMKESKYIRSDLLMNKIVESAFFSAAEKGKIRAAIEKEPGEDVKPVVHAHWIRTYLAQIRTYSGTHLVQTGSYKCSNCGRLSMGDTNYCGSCGAKMDEVEKNADINDQEKMVWRNPFRRKERRVQGD